MKSKRLGIIFISALEFCLGTALTAAETSPLPPEAERLQRSYQAAVDSQIANLRNKYISELKKIGVAAARDGRLKDATQIQAEIDRQAAEEKGDELSKIIAKIVGKWEYKFATISGEWIIRNDYTLINHTGEIGRWSIINNEFVVQGKNVKYVFPLHGLETGIMTTSMLIERGNRVVPATIRKL